MTRLSFLRFSAPCPLYRGSFKQCYPTTTIGKVKLRYLSNPENFPGATNVFDSRLCRHNFDKDEPIANSIGGNARCG